MDDAVILNRSSARKHKWRFSSEIFCGLTESLTRAAIGIAEENDQRNAYLRYVLEPPSKVLLLAVESKKFIEHPTGECRTMGALEALRGVARASLSKQHEFSSNHFFEMLSPLTRVIENAISANSSLVISRAMKLSEILCEIFAMDEGNMQRQQRIREFTLSIVSIFAKSEPTKMTAAALDAIARRRNQGKLQVFEIAFESLNALSFCVERRR